MKNLATMLALIVLAAPVYAQSGGEGDNTGCQGQGNPNSPCDPDDGGGNGGGGGGGNGGNGGNGGSGGDNTSTNDNSNTSTNDNTNTQGQQQGQIQGQIATGGDATATGGNVGDTTATGGTGGNASIIIGGSDGGYGGEGEGQGEGSGNGILSSNVGDTTSESNNTNDNTSNASNGDQTTNVNVSVGEDGPLTASTQTVEGSTLTVEGDEIVYEATQMPVNSAPPSFSAICSSGGAGSGKSFSLSLAVTNDVCQALMVADAYAAMGDMEEALVWVEAAARHAKWKGGMGYFRHVITLGIM